MRRFRRLVQRERCAGTIQTPKLVHHMFILIERRRGLVHLTIVRHPHRPNHGTEANKLHRRHKMDHLVLDQTLFVSDNRTTCRELYKFGILQIAPDDPLDCKVPVVESENGLGRLFLIWWTTIHKVDQFVLVKLFNDPRSAELLRKEVRSGQ